MPINSIERLTVSGSSFINFLLMIFQYNYKAMKFLDYQYLWWSVFGEIQSLYVQMNFARQSLMLNTIPIIHISKDN